jgi:TonB-linked SusC/RagA family outer membrane protein
MERTLKFTNWGLQKKLLLIVCFCVSSVFLYAQGAKTITGVIVDTDGESIIGASITVKETKEGTVSDLDGKFSLQVAPGATLVISYVGFNTQEIPVGNQTNFNIVLAYGENTLDDIVVVGYGSQKKVSLTGAVASIGSEELITTKHGQVQNALSGKVAGVKIISQTSEPGLLNSEISIRGMGAPLLVIDGVPRDNLMRLDENEIESISILKDASASIYGTRASNGVVLITTKKGRQGEKFKFEYNGTVGVQHSLYYVDLLNATEYMTLRNERIFNDWQTTPEYSQSAFDEYTSGAKQSTNWWNPYLKDYPSVSQHNISASGGSDKVDYFVNFGYFDQEGIWKTGNTSYNRYNLRSNVTARLAKGLKAEVLLNMMMDDTHKTGQAEFARVIREAYSSLPLVEPFKDGYFAREYSIPCLTSPKIGYHNYKERLIQSNMALEWEIPGVKGLKVRGMYSFDHRDDEAKVVRTQTLIWNDAGTNLMLRGSNSIRRMMVSTQNTLMQLSASYDNTFNKTHHLSALVLYEESENKRDNFNVQRDMSVNFIDELFAADGNINSLVQRSEKGSGMPGFMGDNDYMLYHNANKGLIGRFNYDYASKYLVEFSFRYDGSSKFAPGHQWGFFPAGSIGWRMSEEAFIKDNTTTVSNWKWRASYGLLGDDSAAAYQWVQGYNYPSEYYVFANDNGNLAEVKGSKPRIANPDISWSTSKILDIGMDIEFWNGLLGLSADVFQRDRSGLYSTSVSVIPGVVGITTMAEQNLNSDRTRGFELSLTHRNKINDFRYNATGFISMDRTKNKYQERTAPVDSYDNWRENTNDRWASILWGYKYLGQYQSFEDIYNSGIIYDGAGNSHMLPGDLIYEDYNGDGMIDENDLQPINIGNEKNPIMNFGLTLGGQYKGFDLNLVFQGTALSHWRRLGGDRDLYSGAFYSNGNGNGFTDFLDRWRRADPMNPDNNQEWIPGKYPSNYSANNRNFIRAASSFWDESTSYLRLKSIELGYTIPEKITRKAGVDRFRIYLNAYNALTFSRFKIADPEYASGANNGEVLVYPLAQHFNVGLNVSF